MLTVSRGRVILKERLEMKEKKTGKHNSIIISNKLRKLIMEYFQKVFPFGVPAYGLDHYLFPSQKNKGEPLQRQPLWEILINAEKSIGLKNIGSHSMRERFGYFFIKMGHQ